MRWKEFKIENSSRDVGRESAEVARFGASSFWESKATAESVNLHYLLYFPTKFEQNRQTNWSCRPIQMSLFSKSLLIIRRSMNVVVLWIKPFIMLELEETSLTDDSTGFSSHSTYVLDGFDRGSFDHLESRTRSVRTWYSSFRQKRWKPYFFKEWTQFGHIRRIERKTFIGIGILNDKRLAFDEDLQYCLFLQQIFHHSRTDWLKVICD